MSSNHNSTKITNIGLSITPVPAPVAAPVRRPFVMPTLVKQGKVAALTNDFSGGGSDIPPIDVP